MHEMVPAEHVPVVPMQKAGADVLPEVLGVCAQVTPLRTLV